MTAIELAALVTLVALTAAIGAIGFWAIRSIERHRIPCSYTPPTDPGPAPDGGHVVVITASDYTQRAMAEAAAAIRRTLEEVA